MKFSVKKYLLYSSVFAIFTEAFFFNFIIDWKLLYLIIIINYFILAQTQKIRLNNFFLLLIGGLFVHGIIANSVIGIPPNFMLAQIIGISIIGIYYYNFIPLYDKNDIIRVYTKLSLYAAVIGYVFYFLNINLNDGRLQSIFKEPAHYAIVVIPACFYYFKQKKYVEFAIIFGSLVLSNSSLGYIGCALMFVVPNLNIKRVLVFTAMIPVIIGAFYYTYTNYPFFKIRVDDTYESLNSINTGKFPQYPNLSSYAILSNIFIAKENITDHPFGSGIGSHVYMHEKVYLKEMRAPQYLRAQDKHTINSSDANSLFVRIMSEMGILGLALVLFFMSKAWLVFKSTHYLSQGIFIYFLLKLFRDGHYFPPELFFFVWFLYYDYFRTKEVSN
ncbi:hypothetical protein FEDK69T_06130 [Flavobacterium enshiense DK69]|uniref:O-antigen ligase-related domain-containing protein n=1 Tax=Flavobacterium enshiense DK69 TaxID=1107311 RepID=V6SC52_9FLAO|nr:O-antigen ligase family protein [Flavobacterium enshiense]ESU24176.1 hypothetical protein FEDK69T_06130 [Flavobacterium enshiense DK69]KGO95447.1 hypothetical protein Q767_11635 [Flavobacterium enshiense DK69]